MTENTHDLRRSNTDELWGLRITTVDNTITFVADVTKNSPAFRAGLNRKDIILKINGETCENRSHDEVCELIQKADLKLRIVTRESTDDEKEAFEHGQKLIDQEKKSSNKMESERPKQHKSGEQDKEHRDRHKAKTAPETAKQTKSGNREKEHRDSHEAENYALKVKTASETAKQPKSGDSDKEHRDGHEVKTASDAAKQPKSGDCEKERRDGHEVKSEPERKRQPKSGDHEKEHQEDYEKKRESERVQQPKSGDSDKEHRDGQEVRDTGEKAATAYNVRPKSREEDEYKRAYKKSKKRNDYKLTTVDLRPMEISSHLKTCQPVAGSSDPVLVGIHKRDDTGGHTLLQPTHGKQTTHFGAKVSTTGSRPDRSAASKYDQKSGAVTVGAEEETKRKDDENVQRGQKRVKGEHEQEHEEVKELEIKPDKKEGEVERLKEKAGAAVNSSPNPPKHRTETKRTVTTDDDQKGSLKSEAARRDQSGPDQSAPEQTVQMRQRKGSISSLKKKSKDRMNKTKSMYVQRNEFPSLTELQVKLQPGHRRTMLLTNSKSLSDRINYLNDL